MALTEIFILLYGENMDICREYMKKTYEQSK